MSVNKAIIMGNLGADPDYKVLNNGSKICNLRVATNDSRKTDTGERVEFTEWHNVVVFGRQAELCAEYLEKASKVYVEGRLHTRKYQDKEGNDKYATEIVAQNVQFISRKRSADTNSQAAVSIPADAYTG